MQWCSNFLSTQGKLPTYSKPLLLFVRLFASSVFDDGQLLSKLGEVVCATLEPAEVVVSAPVGRAERPVDPRAGT